MKKYKVVWIGAKGHGPITHFFEGPSINAAFKEAVKKHQYPEYEEIYIVWHWGLFGKTLVNPHNRNTQKAEAEKKHPQQPARSDGSPQSSGWATLYRVCGGIILVIGFIGTIAVAQKNEEAGFQFAIVAITLTLSSFLAAFLIDVLTDMRHYLKRIAEKE